MQIVNTQIKTEVRTQAIKIKELDFEYSRIKNEKEVKVKELQLENTKLSTEIRAKDTKFKEHDSEFSRLKNEIELERGKRTKAEAGVKNESLLKQAYDKTTLTLKSQKAHIDEL